jgi:hypothetical protein
VLALAGDEPVVKTGAQLDTREVRGTSTNNRAILQTLFPPIRAEEVAARSGFKYRKRRTTRVELGALAA